VAPHEGEEGRKDEASPRQQQTPGMADRTFFSIDREPVVCFIIHRDHRAEKFTTAKHDR